MKYLYTKQIKTLYMDIESEFILGIKSCVAAQRIKRVPVVPTSYVRLMKSI